MRWLGAAAMLACFPVLLATQWLYFPVGHGYSALQYPLFANAGPRPAFLLASFGALVGLLLIGGALAALLLRWGWLWAIGAGLMITGLWGYLRIVSGDSGLLAELAHQAVWLHKAYVFDALYLPRNAASEASLWKQFSFETVWDRLISGWYFMGVGWLFTVVVGAVVFGSGVHGLDRRGAVRATALTIVALVVTAALLLGGPVMGQRAVARAIQAEARDQPVEAIRNYRRAIDLDGWAASNLSLRARIGAIEGSEGYTATPEYRIYQAETLVGSNQTPGTVGQLPQAIELYRELAAGRGAIAALASVRGAELASDYGFNLFGDGAFGSAVGAWESALALDPGMWLAAFYLSRGYYAAARYQAAEQISRATLAATSDPRLLGDLYSNLGDALTRLGHFNEGHLAYAQAYKWDYMSNYRGLNSLVGP